MHFWIPLVCFTLCLWKVYGRGRLEVKLIRYDNPGGKGDNGNPCDGFGFIKRSDCDQFFQICVDWEANGSPAMGDCDVGYIQTGYVHNQDSFDFGDVIGEAPDSIETPNPVIFGVNTWDPQGIRVKVHVWDDDSSNDDEDVELLPPATIHLQPAASIASAPFQEKIISGRTTLTINVRAYCLPDYYGSDCSVYCVASNDTSGHHECGTDGSKQCHPGWEGANCETSVDDCAPNPCLNGGVCQDEHETYSCQCLPQYTGTNCDETIPMETTSAPGDHRSTEDVPVVTTVETPDVTSGIVVQTTEADVDTTQNNDGTSRPVVITTADVPPLPVTTAARADPLETTTGALGELEVTTSATTSAAGTPQPGSGHPCHMAPCQNGGSCEEARGDRDYECQCMDGFAGANCEIVIDNCASSPCGQGSCESRPGSFVCDCYDGWDGDTCNSDIDECRVSTPCQNGGACLNSPGSYTCSCEPGFTGATCEQEIPCSCQHGGSCVYTNNDVTCNCVGGWSGAECSISPCSTSPCQNLGHCVESNSGFSCTCEPGYTGDLCEEDIDDCLTHGCQHDSVCVDGVNSYTCSCPKGFRGNRCQTAKDLADEPYTLTFDGVMDREDLGRARSEIAGFVAKAESVQIEELSVQHQAGSCKTRTGSEVTIYEFEVLDAQDESLRVKDLDGLAAELEAHVFTGLECAGPQTIIRESKQNDGTDHEYLRTVLIVVICCLCVVLIVLIAGLIYYNKKQDPKNADTDMIANGSFKYHEVSPVATTNRSTDRTPRSFRCHSGDYQTTELDMA